MWTNMLHSLYNFRNAAMIESGKIECKRKSQGLFLVLSDNGLFVQANGAESSLYISSDDVLGGSKLTMEARLRANKWG